MGNRGIAWAGLGRQRNWPCRPMNRRIFSRLRQTLNRQRSDSQKKDKPYTRAYSYFVLSNRLPPQVSPECPPEKSCGGEPARGRSCPKEGNAVAMRGHRGTRPTLSTKGPSGPTRGTVRPKGSAKFFQTSTQRFDHRRTRQRSPARRRPKSAKQSKCQTVYKPGSVRPRGDGTTIPLGRILRCASRDQPGRRDWNIPAIIPGLHPRHPSRPYSVVLPVGFTVPPLLPGARCALTAPFRPYPRDMACRSRPLLHGRFVFCGTFPRVAPAGR
jgi:hypothetical protein